MGEHLMPPAQLEKERYGETNLSYKLQLLEDWDWPKKVTDITENQRYSSHSLEELIFGGIDFRFHIYIHIVPQICASFFLYEYVAMWVQVCTTWESWIMTNWGPQTTWLYNYSSWGSILFYYIGYILLVLLKPSHSIILWNSWKCFSPMERSTLFHVHITSTASEVKSDLRYGEYAIVCSCWRIDRTCFYRLSASAQ